jgi:uncharacterized protein
MQSLLDPAVLFFVFGIAAGLVKSNLEIPPQIARFLSLYLLTQTVATSLVCAVLLAIAVPASSYLLLRRVLNEYDAVAVAATYGSVSAVTFITASQFLVGAKLPYGGHMAAAMALMESPAIIMAVILANRARKQAARTGAQTRHSAATSAPIGHILRESLTDGTQLLLLGAMVIGIVTGTAGQAAMKPFTGDLFKGMLAFFLLDMGLQAARSMGDLRGKSMWLLMYAVLGPLVHASVALLMGRSFGMSVGDTALLMVLAASASYIAVPAVLKHAIPEASPSLYFGMSLGLTFPFNILIGIPLYVHAAQRWVG